MNIRLLRRIQRAIAKAPGKFQMGYWFLPAWTAKGKPECVACIGGWAIALKQNKPLESFRDFRGASESTARRALGLTERQAKRLFYWPAWPFTFQIKRDDPRNAIKRIECFIETKGKQ